MNKNNKHPFKTPENYFDSFQDKMMEKLFEDQCVIPKDRAFKVPANYFETFNARLTGRLNKETKVVHLYPVKKIIAIAASIAAVMLIYLGLNWNKAANEINFSDLANTDIEAYFENNELDLTPYEIAEVIPVTNTELSDILNSPIENENILDYLNENINDLEDLNLQDDE
jgi:hypothetical protein